MVIEHVMAMDESFFKILDRGLGNVSMLNILFFLNTETGQIEHLLRRI